jgi:hypothetical protein
MDTSQQTMSDVAKTRSWLFCLATFLLLGIIIVLAVVIWHERTVVRGEYEQKALNGRWEEDHIHARNIAAIFLRAIVEDDYPATRPLLKQVASTTPHAPEAYGPEVALRNRIQAWLTERKLAGKRFKGYGFGGNHPDMSLVKGRYIQIGALFFEDGRFVNYHLTLRRTDARNGYDSTDYGWRVDEFILWSGEQDGPMPW